MSEFSFKRGTFTKLRANTIIHLGRLERNIYEGEVVEYDGLQLKFSGQTTEMPELKAGVKRGWLSIVQEESAVSEPVATPAPAPAPKKEMPVQSVYDEERSVAEVNPKKEGEKTKRFPLVVESQDDDIIAVAKVENKSGAEVTNGVAEMQDADTVSTIKLSTSSKQKTVISDGSQASAEISKLDNLEAPVTEMSKTASQPVVELQDDVSAKLNVAQEEPEMTPTEEQDLENKQILQVIDGGVESAQGAIALGKDNSKIKVLPGGVEWDTSKHWSKRAKIALEMYGDQPEVIQEIIKVESKGVVAAIEKGLDN
jgi:hypothetical protein